MTQAQVNDHNMTDYEAERRSFRLDAPADFNWAFDVIDRWAADPQALAMHWVSPQGEERRITFEQFRMIERFEAQLVARVGCVADQFAQEDLAIRIQRVDHQVEELFHLGLEAARFTVCGCRCSVGHWSSSPGGDSVG